MMIEYNEHCVLSVYLTCVHMHGRWGRSINCVAWRHCHYGVDEEHGGREDAGGCNFVQSRTLGNLFLSMVPL